MNIKPKHWHDQAWDLRLKGYSLRDIGMILNLGKSTVHDYFKKIDCKEVKFLNEFNEKTQEVIEGEYIPKGPRIFVYDIETAPIMAHVWKLWDNNVGLNQIEADWYIMSFCGKWLGEDEIYYFDQRHVDPQDDDKVLLGILWEFLNEADIVIGQNIKRFDTKKVNARFILNGYPKPRPYRQIDTMVIAKEQFGFTSNKLEYMSKALCPEHVKSKHSKYPGHEMWVECMKGNLEAWEEMEAYNRDDVLATEALYNKLCVWDSKLPNFDVYNDEISDMSEWVEDGFITTNLARYQNYRNIRTGQHRRGRVNLLSKDKRQSLLAN